MDVIGGMFGTTASAFGNNTWLVIAVIVTAVIMAFGIAGGIEKLRAIRGAINGHYINTLITDIQCAEALISE